MCVPYQFYKTSRPIFHTLPFLMIAIHYISTQGNTMDAEIPAAEAPRHDPVIQAGHSYIMSRFRVCNYSQCSTRYLPTVTSVGRELIIILLLLLTTKAAYSSSEISRPLLKYVISRKLYTFYGRARDSARHLLVRGGKGH